MAKLKCIKTVIMTDGRQAFTEGQEYKARKGNVPGLDGQGYLELPTPVLRARNDFNELHVIKNLNSSVNDVFYATHFAELK